ncbi:ABC transporter ATP-binding protein [Verminephrobacter aporrectodeae subsp. tuberculatae]|uniref:ABC transporter ATP-binding protein n=1 Tax=Verminephrobacter aporrectodeae TaxID=1110389 RepID=UPI00224383DC|nr:ABC transporter ATP-binding protein [Verminephrobacter aporrectodeae]MCW8206811.1 ABC transporter ATP-binding protein [Verminephrobacter aporrectodeae subsp. tuberculatae]
MNDGAGFCIHALDAGYGSRRVLSQLSLAPAAPGSMIGLLGPNGAGKSTVLRACARLLPVQGELRLGSLDLLRCPRDQHLRHVAYLPQVLPQASTLRVLESIAGALRATRPDLRVGEREARLQAVLTELQLLPLALRRLDQLSGGQRQMVGLAQALVRRAPLMLLDEPTSALDLRWQMLTLQALRQAARERGAIVCVAMHDLNLAARHCDRLVLLGAPGTACLQRGAGAVAGPPWVACTGGLLAEGAPDAVLRPELLRAAYGIEARVERSAGQACVVLVERALSLPEWTGAGVHRVDAPSLRARRRV